VNEAIPVAVILAIVPTMLYLVVLNLVDRYEKEPWTILLACIGLGAVVAPALGLGALVVLGRTAALTPQFAAGAAGADPVVAIVQEAAKALVLLGLIRFVRDEFDDVLDGVIYGAAIGAGFAAAETFIFALGGTDTLGNDTLVQLIVAGLDHAFYTAVFGAIAGAATRVASGRMAGVVVLYGLATAILLHALHDGLPAILSRLLDQPDEAVGSLTRLAAVAVNVTGIILLAVVVLLALRREARVLRGQLREEVELGVLGEADYVAVPAIRPRLARQLAARRTHGQAGFRAARTIHATAAELAFHKERLEVRHRHRPPEERTDVLRAEIRRNREILGEIEP
jgi:RsiW-degrading membrane proteinase PrsW (M82 family)